MVTHFFSESTCSAFNLSTGGILIVCVPLTTRTSRLFVGSPDSSEAKHLRILSLSDRHNLTDRMW